MKLLLTACMLIAAMVVYSQASPQQPIEAQYHISYWWWAAGVILALLIGAGVYMLIKKNPRKDAW